MVKVFCKLFGHKFEEDRPFTAPNMLFCVRQHCTAWRWFGDKHIHYMLANPSPVGDE